MSTSNPPQIPSEKSTFGLPKGIHNAIGQAIATIDSEPLRQSLLLLITTTRTWGNSRRFATVLAEVSNPLAIVPLKLWASQNVDAALLYSISSVVGDYPLFRKLIPLPRAVPARVELNELKIEYLTGLVLERIPPISPEDKRWLAVLRLWLIVHALYRTRRTGATQDLLIKGVGDGIRKGCEKPGPWRDLLLELRCFADDFEQLNSHFRNFPKRIEKSKELGATQLTFLSQLRRVATFELATKPEPSPIPELINQVWPEQLDVQFTGPIILSEENESLGTRQEFSGDQIDPIVQFDVDPNQSFAQQEKYAKTILTLSTEQLHYLPWSSEKVTPFELGELADWMKNLLHNDGKKQRLLGACIYISISAGRSLFQVGKIPIDTIPQSDWTLIRNLICLQRTPPRRQSAWQAKTDKERTWVTPRAEKISLRLPATVARVLADAITDDPAAGNIAEIWAGVGEDPEKIFKALIPAELRRVTPGRLRGLLGQQLINIRSDHVFSRLLSSHPDSALPGSCAYPSWDLQATEGALNSENIQGNIAEVPSNLIGLGSELDPDEMLLTQEIRRGGTTVLNLSRGDNCFAYHNALTIHVVWALMAATGARFVKDPFENPRFFDLHEQFVYLDDKVSGKGREGRIVPLPNKLCDFLRDEYPKHLRLLASTLDEKVPHLAAAIRTLASGAPSEHLPYFFRLQEEPFLTWVSISPSYSVSCDVFQCPLPAHLFRNRFSNQLRNKGISPEVIEGYLGHQESGVMSYGDYSVRSWGKDAEQARGAINEIFESLPFILPLTPDSLPTLPAFKVTDELPAIPIFGSSARQKTRLIRFKSMVRLVNDIIEDVSEGKELHELSDEKLSELSKCLIFTPAGLPHTQGRERYAIFMRKLEHAWRNNGKRVKLRRRYAWLKAEESPFKACAPGSLAKHSTIRGALKSILKDISPSRITPKWCLALATLQFCVECRVTSKNLLDDLLRNRNYRLVVYRKTAWLEYSAELNRDDPDAPVQRYRIPHLNAKLFDRALSAKQSIDVRKLQATKHISNLLNILQEDFNPKDTLDIQLFVHHIAEIIDQANAIELPGLVGAYLAGRVSSTSLGWRDWMRLERNIILDISQDAKNIQSTTRSDILPFVKPYEVVTNLSAMESCRSFFREFRLEIPKSYEETKYSTERKRVILVNKLNAFIESWSGRVCGTAILFSAWIVQQALKKIRSGQRLSYFTFNSMRRYLSAVSPGIKSFGYEIDLLSATSQEITDLYLDVISGRDIVDEEYVAIVVKEFHQWARELGVSDPHWEDIPIEKNGRGVSPGIITEDEYLASIGLLLKFPDVDYDFRRDATFLLLVCYRFGLRNDDAIGLTRSDLQPFADGIQIYVHDNRTRKLKSGPSRRVVPLVFKLTKDELRIISDHMDLTDSRYGDENYAPLFSETSLRANWKLQNAVNTVLKSVTGNPKTTLHHARHAAANRLAPALYQASLPEWWRLTENYQNEQKNIIDIILARPACGRSVTWAVGRYLGHSGAYSSVSNYLHCIGDWSNELVNAGDESGGTLKTATVLHKIDHKKRPKIIDGNQLKAHEFEVPTPSSILRFLRLIARGLCAERAGNVMKFSPVFYIELDEAIRQIGSQQKISGIELGDEEGTQDSYEFLRHINDRSWSRLIKKVENLTSKSISLLPITLPELAVMVSPQRQVVMWTQNQIQSIAKILEYYSIRSSEYAVFHRSMSRESEIIQWATTNGFNPIEMNYKKGVDTPMGKRIIRLDIVKNGATDIKRGLHLVQLNFKNDIIHSNFDWIALLIAAVASFQVISATDAH